MGPDETISRDQEPDLHRLRQTEYRVRFRSRHRHSDHTSRISRLPNDPMQVNVPREPAPPPTPAFLHPAFVSIATGSAAPMKPTTLTSHTTCDRQGRGPRCCASSVLAHAPAGRYPRPSLIVFATLVMRCTNVHCVWSAITV